jgi:CHAD domain-containing protein
LMPNEIEAKFVVPDDEIAKQLRAIITIDTLKLTHGVTAHVHDTYFDTADRRLLAAGYASRRRHAAPDSAVQITVKQIVDVLGAIHEREELEITLTEDVPPAQWPESPARDRIMSIIGDAPLQTLFELRQTRAKRDVLKDESVIAEWSMDDVRVRAGNHHLKFAELEIELLPQGTTEDLANLAARVQDKWSLTPEGKSKFERALAFVDQVKAIPQKQRRRLPKIRLDDSMAQAARKTLLQHWERMLEHEAGARAGTDIEQVHDMRVATRRLRAALRVFADHLDADTYKPFIKMLQRTAHALGAVRDLDVFRDKAQKYLSTLPDERKAELDPLLAAWQTEYLHARGKLIELLDSHAYTRMKTEFAQLLRTPGAGAAATEMNDGTPIAQRVRDVVPIMLLRGWAIVHAYDESVCAPDVPLARLHQLRIASKDLRYTLEFFADVMNPNAQTLIEQMKQLQDHLGNLQDAVVACNLLYDFLTWGEWGHSARRSLHRPSTLIIAPAVAAYLSVRQSEIHELVQTFPQVWLPISQPAFRRQLLAVLVEW